jgi:hypothetical protein
MPSTSPAMKRLMAAVAHGWHKPGGGGPSVAVAKEFNQADKGTKMGYAKGGDVSTTKYAKGGPVLGRQRDFLKESDGADQRYGGPNTYKDEDSKDENYGKEGKNKGEGDFPVKTRRTGTKTLKTVKPRK